MFKKCNAQQLAAASSLIAIILSRNLDLDEMNILGNFITAIGTVLLTMAAQLASEQNQGNSNLNEATEKCKKRMSKKQQKNNS